MSLKDKRIGKTLPMGGGERKMWGDVHWAGGNNNFVGALETGYKVSIR